MTPDMEIGFAVRRGHPEGDGVWEVLGLSTMTLRQLNDLLNDESPQDGQDGFTT
jgi:hypothetical protein